MNVTNWSSVRYLSDWNLNLSLNSNAFTHTLFWFNSAKWHFVATSENCPSKYHPILQLEQLLGLECNSWAHCGCYTKVCSKWEEKNRQKRVVQNAKLAFFCEELAISYVGVLPCWAGSKPFWGSCRFVSFRKRCDLWYHLILILKDFFMYAKETDIRKHFSCPEPPPSLSFQLILCPDTGAIAGLYS